MFDDVRLLELQRREIDRHAHPFGPGGRVAASLPQNPGADLDDETRFFGDRNEDARRHHSPLGVAPADQRLQRDDRAIAGVDDGLIVDDKLLSRERLSELLLDLAFFDQRRLHLRRVGNRSAAGGRLGLIKSEIGAFEQVDGRARVARRRGDANAGADGDPMAFDYERPLHFVENACCQLVYGCRRRVADEHTEFIAAKPGHDRGRADAGAQSRAHLCKKLIADEMPQRIVDLLEAVEIDGQQRRRRSAFFNQRERFGQRFLKMVTVWKPGHFIEMRDALDLPQRPLARRDVLHNRDEGAGVGPRAMKIEVAFSDLVHEDIGLARGCVTHPPLREQLRFSGRHVDASRDRMRERVEADRRGGGDDAEEIDDTAIDHRYCEISVAHAQAMRHRIQRNGEFTALTHRVETVSQSGFEMALQDAGRFEDRDGAHQEKSRNAPIPGREIEQQRQGEGRAGAHHLPEDDVRARGVARGEIARDAGHDDEAVIGDHLSVVRIEQDRRGDAERRHEANGADSVAPLPFRRLDPAALNRRAPMPLQDMEPVGAEGRHHREQR